jgi:competence protein ComEC
MQLLQFHSIRLFIFLSIGIFIGHNFPIDFTWSFYSSVTLLIVLGSLWWFLRNTIIRSPFFVILSYLCVLNMGIHTYTIHNDLNRNNHYSKFQQSQTAEDLILRLKERLKPSANYHKYIAEVVALKNNRTTGRILVNLNKDTKNDSLNIDDYLFVNTALKTINPPLNPHQFNYRDYLKLKNIYHQVYLNPNHVFKTQENTLSLYGYADLFRAKINENLMKIGVSKEVLSIMNAMLLGQRQDLDSSIYNNYVNSGTIHILAVSGLHVGIILLILNALLKPLLYLKYGRIVRPVLIVSLLWGFALVAGLSPSVTRAVAMFSIISIAMHLKRPTNIYNTLAISAFVILLVNPFFLFQVGFQMSYTSVIGIVSIQPKLYNLLKLKFWIFDKLWQVLTVSVAAQIAVLPVSLYYFHQFPGLFFVANLVVIPFLGIILGIGLMVIILAALDLQLYTITWFYSFIIEALNDFIAWIASFEEFLFRDIPFSLTQLVISYVIIIAIVQLLITKKTRWLFISLIGFLSFQFYGVLRLYKENPSFIIFHKSRYTVIGQHYKDELHLHHNLDSLAVPNEKFITNYTLEESIKTLHQEPLETVYQAQHKTILVIDSLGVYENLSFKPDYILLRNTPRINLNRLIDSIRPKRIIADGSNYRTYIQRWERSCRTKNTTFHYTGRDGAFILR